MLFCDCLQKITILQQKLKQLKTKSWKPNTIEHIHPHIHSTNPFDKNHVEHFHILSFPTRDVFYTK